MSQINSCLVAQLTQGFQTTVVDAATTTGTDFSTPFAIQMRQVGLKRTVNYNCTGTFTVCTVQLQQSFDGGSTFVDVGAAMDFYANKAGDLFIVNGVAALTPGAIYQFDVASITGTSITIQVTIS